MAEEKPKSGESTDPGVGRAQRGPSREPTVLGVGLSAPVAVPAAAPVVVVGHTRERTVLGVAPSTAAPPPRLNHLAREASLQEPPPEGWDEPVVPPPPRAEASVAAREPSIAVDLSELDSPAKKPHLMLAIDPSVSLVPAGVPRRRGWKWMLVLLVLALVAGAGYVRRQQVLPLLQRLQQGVVTKTRALLSVSAEGFERCPGRASPDADGEQRWTPLERAAGARPGSSSRRLLPPEQS